MVPLTSFQVLCDGGNLRVTIHLRFSHFVGKIFALPPHISSYECNLPGALLVCTHFFLLSHVCEARHSHWVLWKSPPQDADVDFTTGAKAIASEAVEAGLNINVYLFTLDSLFVISWTPRRRNTCRRLLLHSRHTLPLLINLSLHDTSSPPSIRVFYCYKANTRNRQKH